MTNVPEKESPNHPAGSGIASSDERANIPLVDDRSDKLLKRQAELETELIRAQAAREQAEAASSAKDRVLAMLSHELRTPLTPILLATSILSQAPSVPDEIRDELKNIARNVELEARLIDNLLDATQLSLGKFSLMLEMIDVNTLLHFALKICLHDIAAKELTVHCDLAATENDLRADPARLQQVFWNLIKNAVKFTTAVR